MPSLTLSTVEQRLKARMRPKRGGYPVACDTPNGTQLIGLAHDEPEAHAQLLAHCKPMGLIVVTAELVDLQVGDIMAQAWMPNIVFQRQSYKQLTHGAH